MEVPPSPHPRVKSVVFREFPHIVLKHLTEISFDQKQKKTPLIIVESLVDRLRILQRWSYKMKINFARVKTTPIEPNTELDCSRRQLPFAVIVALQDGVTIFLTQ